LPPLPSFVASPPLLPAVDDLPFVMPLPVEEDDDAPFFAEPPEPPELLLEPPELLAAPPELFAPLDGLPAFFDGEPELLADDAEPELSVFVEELFPLAPDEIPPPEFLDFDAALAPLADFAELLPLRALLLPAFEDELALFVLDEESLSPPELPPFDFDAELFPPPAPVDLPPSSISPTASATAPKIPTAAPVAAFVRISPATSLAVSKMPGSDFFLEPEEFFSLFLPLFDFAAEVDFEPLDF
jgi:hypothetical protein